MQVEETVSDIDRHRLVTVGVQTSADVFDAIISTSKTTVAEGYECRYFSRR